MLSDDILMAKKMGKTAINLYSEDGLYLKGGRVLKIKEITYKKALELAEKKIIDIEREDIILADRLSVEIIIGKERPSIIRGYVSHS